MSEHRIRLAGPWQFRLSGQSGSGRSERLPLSGAGVTGAAKVQLTRGFHAPPRLSSDSRLRRAYVGSGQFVVQLNGEVLGCSSELAGEPSAAACLPERCCRIPTELLKSFNEVQFEVVGEQAEEWSLAGVWLVISEPCGQPVDGGES
ncbi:MAG: hypothetical protein ACK5MO_05055 [Planctomyces sp.]